MSHTENEFSQERKSVENQNEDEIKSQAAKERRVPHSILELLQVAKDMGDQRVVDAILKKMEE